MEYIQAVLYVFNCILYPVAEVEILNIMSIFALLWYVIKRRKQLKYIGASFVLMVLALGALYVIHPGMNVMDTSKFLGGMFLNSILMIFVIFNCRKWKMENWAWCISVLHGVLTVVALIFHNDFFWRNNNMMLMYREPRFLTYTCGILVIFYLCKVLKKEVDSKVITGLVIAVVDIIFSRINTGISIKDFIYHFELSAGSIFEQTGMVGFIILGMIAIAIIAVNIIYGTMFSKLMAIYVVMFQFFIGHLTDPASWFIIGWIVANCLDEQSRRKVEREKADGTYQEPARRPLKIGICGHKKIIGREGGVEIVVQEISERLVKKGHHVTVYDRKGHHVSGAEFDNPYYDSINEYKGIKIIKVPTVDRAGFSALFYSILASIHMAFSDYDVVMYHAEGPSVMCWLPSLFGIPVVAENHGLDWARQKWGGAASRLIKAGEIMMASQSECLIVLSRHIQEYFWDVYHKKSTIVPNGVDRGIKREAKLIKEKYNLDKEYILSLNRLVPEKGIHYLIKAYKMLEEKSGKENLPKLVIAGGISGTEGYGKELMDLANGDENIIFTGFVQGKLLEELYSNCYLYVLPSDVEGMPLSLLEAMSFGCACLTSDITECWDVVRDYGMTFEKSNVNDLESKLEYALDNRNVIEQYKKNAADYICKRHNWDSSVDMIEELMYKAVAKRKR